MSNSTQQSQPPQVALNQIIGLYNQGQLEQTVSLAESLAKQYPNTLILYDILGAAYMGLKNTEKTIASYKKALQLNPNHTDAYNNMGMALYDQGRFDEAVESYQKAINLESDFADAHYNLANALKQLGELKQAIESYRASLAINPNDAEVLLNCGNALKNYGDFEQAIGIYAQALKLDPNSTDAQINMKNAIEEKTDIDNQVSTYARMSNLEIGSAEIVSFTATLLKARGYLDAAIDGYAKAIEINPYYAEAHDNLDILLTEYTPKKSASNNTILSHQKLREISLMKNDLEVISEKHITNIVSEIGRLLEDHNVSKETRLSQIYRRNEVSLNCERHMKIFNDHSIIPEFCFGCYKVQVEPKSIIELLSLFIIFDHLKLDNNNLRKCIVELRPEISGFYKGLIYCSGLDEAASVAKYIDAALHRNIRPTLSSKIKRGCSEYPLSFPLYQKINMNGPQPMNYNPDWKQIEKQHDKIFPSKHNNNLKPTLRGLSLLDCKILKNWFGYAKGLGDTSLDLINDNINFNQDFFEIAQTRLQKHHFKQ